MMSDQQMTNEQRGQRAETHLGEYADMGDTTQLMVHFFTDLMHVYGSQNVVDAVDMAVFQYKQERI